MGVLQGTKTLLLQTEEGQILPSHSVAPGLDYPGVGPEHVYLHHSGRARYDSVNDAQALAAFHTTLCRKEGIIPALESSHALAWVLENAASLPRGGHVVVNLSGRGDKDLGNHRGAGPVRAQARPVTRARSGDPTRGLGTAARRSGLKQQPGTAA